MSGLFTQAGGKPAARIAKWNGIEWSNVGAGFNLRANALCVYDDGLGGGPAPIGVYLDKGPGTPVTPIPLISGGTYTMQHTATAAIPPGAINPTGLNRLFVYQRNAGCAASGLIYSARIDFCPGCATPPWAMGAWWPLDETGTTGLVADDLTANNNTGQWQGGPTPVPGVVDGALHFDGNDSVFVPANPALELHGGDFTVDAWIRWEQSSISFPTIVSSTTVSPNNWYRLLLVPNTSPPLAENLGFWIESGSNSVFLQVQQVIPDGEWVHVAATLHQPSPGAGVCTLYVNGYPVHTETGLPTFAINPTGTTRIGSNWPPGTGANSFFQGDIDEVELFCRALSAAEIYAIWQAGALGKCKEQCWASSNRQSCGNGSLGDAEATIVNRSGVARTYSYTITETPGCTVTGMTYVPSAGTISVGPNGTGTVKFGAIASGASGYGQACFRVEFMNQSSGNDCSALGSVNYSDCYGVTIGECCEPVSLSIGGQGFGTFQLIAGADGADLDYQIVAIPQDASMYETPLSLGDLPPGEPIVGSLTLAPFEDSDIDFGLGWFWCGWFALPFEVQLLVAPAGSGGPFQAISSFTVTMGEAASCVGDLNGDGVVDGADLGIMLGSWGAGGLADLDGNGVVDGADLGLLLGAWGPCP